MWNIYRDVLTGGCSTNKVDILIRSLIVAIYVVKINITKQKEYTTKKCVDVQKNVRYDLSTEKCTL